MARTVSVIYQARVDGYNKAVKSAADSTRNLGKTAEKSMSGMAEVAERNRAAADGLANSLGLVGLATTALGGLAVREFASFDQAMSGVASTGEDARNSIDELKAAAQDLGASTVFSAVEAAQGIEELARAGVAASDILNGGLAGALDLAAAGEMEVAEAAGIASAAMTQFKLSGRDVPHIADLLAAGAGKAMGDVRQLGQALKQSGLVASQFGLSIEETVGGLSAFASAGLLGSDAGTSFKTMLLALADPAKRTKEKLEELGIQAYDAQGQFIGLAGLAGELQTSLGGLTDAQRQQALGQIFGNDAIRAASVLYEEGAAGVQEWTTAVDDAGYAAETAATKQDNLIGDLEKLGGAWSSLATSMGEAANGPLRGLVQALTDLTEAAAEHPQIAAGVGLLVSGLGGGR